MGQIKIMDVGYILPTNEGKQATSGNRANSGAAIALKTAQFTPSLSRNIQSDPELSSNTPTRINLGSLENMQFELRCVLKTSDSTDMSYVPALLDLVCTNGYKLMWYDYSAAGEDNNGQLIYRIATNSKFGHQLTAGEMTAFSIGTAFYHLHVLFFDIQPVHSGSKSLIEYSLKGIVIKAEQNTEL